MVLNYIWIGFFLLAFIVALYKTIFQHDYDVFSAIVSSTFDLASVSFEISIGLTGILCLWLGIMNIGERGGAVQVLSRLVAPLFNKLFPDVPENHPARGSMMMNFSANMLGLDNAATPMGLKAMNELQELNTKKDTASNSQIMFLVLNTSGLTLIPITVMNYRSQFGAENPADVFIPILIATFFASLIGLITVAIYQKINLFNKVILAYLFGLTSFILFAIYYFSNLSPEQLKIQSSLISSIILYGLICVFILLALRKKVNVYDAFIEGAKNGFNIAIKIIPYLVAILVSIGVFRASGAMDIIILGIASLFALFMENTEFVHGLPTALMKPLSGSGARGMMLESFQHFGVDSFVGKLTSTLQGATDTTFYIIAVYFGSVSIRKTRYAITAGLIADFTGIIVAIIVASLFFASSSKSISNNELVDKYNSFILHQEFSEIEGYISENIIFFDSQKDTIAHNTIELSQAMNYMQGFTFVWTKELSNDEMLVRYKNSDIIRTHKLTIKNSKLIQLEYLGYFRTESKNR
jgi:spore maturation protein SpmA